MRHEEREERRAIVGLQGEVIDIRTCEKKRPENKRHVRALQLRRTEERV
jgi:hypothetical protein